MEIPVQNLTKGRTIITRVEASDRQRTLLLVGGLLNSVKADASSDAAGVAGVAVD